MTPNDKYFCFQPAVVFDAPPIGKTFGAVLSDVQTSAPYHAGDIVSAQFVGANPRVSEFCQWLRRFSTVTDNHLISHI